MLKKMSVLVAAVFIAVAGFVFVGQRAQAGNQSRAGDRPAVDSPDRAAAPALPNFDIRASKVSADRDFIQSARFHAGRNASEVADLRDGFVRGEETLRARIPHVKFEYNDLMRIPEVITPDVWRERLDFLTEPSTAKRPDALRSFVKENSELFGVRVDQANGLKVVVDAANPDGHISYAYLQQRIKGVPVFRGEVKAGFNKDGQIIRVINNLTPGVDESSVPEHFGDPADAVAAAARHIDHDPGTISRTLNAGASTGLKAVFGTDDWAPTAEKMYFPTEPGVVVAAWRVLIWEPVYAYYVIVDAQTGTMLWRKNITSHQTQAVTYNVYNNPLAYMQVADSPAPMSPGPINPTLGTQAPLGTRSNVTLIGNEAPYNFNTNGWVTDGTNVTDGNAVEAGVDRTAPDGVDATQTGSPNRVFTSTWNPAPGNPAPGDNPLDPEAQRGAVVQMFYVMNRYHDTMYRLGWTEQFFNFQHDNFGRGGAGGDRVSAQGQDNTGGTSSCPAPPCFNNANFGTPADGSRPRMQMYLWSGPTPDYDGTADAEVIIHEVTHGLSNRLHGNTSGLSTNMADGMGEGWGDFYAYTMLAEPADPIDGIYTVGGYATYLATGSFSSNYYHGIRRFPRAPITFLGPNGKPHNPFTFRYINAGCSALIGNTSTAVNSAYPRGPFGSSTCDQVHNIGEVWSSMLWEIRNRMVQRLGFTAGTTQVLQAVTDGMKLAPLAPTFLSERDAIIIAAFALPGGMANVNDVREGFRVRGLGRSASIQNIGSGANNTAVTEAFDSFREVESGGVPIVVGESCAPANGAPDPDETVIVSVPLINSGLTPLTNVVATLQASGGVSATGAPQIYGVLSPGGPAVSRPFTFTVDAACGSILTLSIQVQDGATNLGVVTFTMDVGAHQVLTTENFDGVAAPSLPAGWTASGTAPTWATSSSGAPSPASDSSPNSAFAANSSGASDKILVMPSFTPVAGGQLRFRNNFNTEAGWDGGVLEISINGGAYQDIISAGGSFEAGGYTGTLGPGTGNNIANRAAWTGNSAGFITSTVNLPASAAGQPTNLRFRMGSDDNTAATGWRIDNVQVLGALACVATCNLPTTTTLTSSANSSVTGQNVTFMAEVSPIPSGGTITFIEGGSCAAPLATLGGPTAVNASGQASFSTSALAVGVHVVRACYGGTGGFLPSNGTVTQTVNPAATTTTITSDAPDASVFGQNYTVAVAVAASAPGSGTPAGGVTVSDGTNSCNIAALAGGAGSCALPSTAVGPKTLTATYGGSSSYLGSSGTASHTVNKADTTVALVAAPAPSTYGQNLTLTATVAANPPGAGTPASGSVNFSDGAAAIASCQGVAVNASGVATCSVNSLPAGAAKTLSAVYSGNTNFNGSTGTTAQTVNKAILTVTASSPTVTYGDIAPAITPSLAGFVLSETPAVATTLPACTTTYAQGSGVSGSPYTTSCSGGSAANYTFSFVNGGVTVNKAPLTVTADDKTRTYGAANPTLTGTITGFVLNQTLATSGLTGAAQFTTTAAAGSPVGGYPITASLGTLASPNYTFAFAPGTLSVTPATLTVNADNKARVYGQLNPTLTHQIAGFQNGESLATSGVTGSPAISTMATQFSAPGAYAIVPALGTLAAQNYAFAFANGTLTVAQAVTTIAITNAAALVPTTTVGQQYAVNFTVAPAAPGAGVPTGTVTVADGTGATCTATLAAASNGVGSCDLTSTTAGSKTLTANYQGDVNFTASTSAGVPHGVVISIVGNVKQFIIGGPNTNLPNIALALEVDGVPAANATTDAGGNFAFTLAAGGSTIRLTAERPGKVFDPASRTIGNVTANVAGANFVAYDRDGPNFNPRVLRVVDTGGTAGQPVTVPVQIASLGNETSFSFSLAFDPAMLPAPSSISCGSGFAGCTVAPFNIATPGRVGITVTRATAPTAGVRELIRITWPTNASASGNASITFADAPTLRGLADASGDPVPARYTAGAVAFPTVPSGFSVTGRVMTPSGSLLRGELVRLTPSGGGPVRTTTTSSFGVYSFADVPAGEYTVTVVPRRFRFAPKTLTLNGPVTNLDFVAME